MSDSHTSRKTGSGIIGVFDRAPVLSFTILLIALVLVIVGANLFRAKEEPEPEIVEKPIEVETYSIGAAPKIRTQAEIEKSGVVNMVAQAAGVVQQINVTEGETVWRGSNIVWFSTNYQGGVAQSVQRQKAQVSYEHNEETLPQEKELIEDKREVAKKIYENAIELKKIQDESEQETRDTIQYNEDLLDQMQEQIETLEALMDPSKEGDIIALKSQRASLLNATNQLKQSLRNTEYNTRGVDHEDKTDDEKDDDKERDENNIAKRLDQLQRDITLKQLDLEEKAKELAVETSKLDLRLAQIQEALMYPASPVNGVVERVFVQKGQVVNPGDPIAMVTADDNSATAVALVSSDIARNVSMVEPSSLGYNGTVLTIHPTYISREPTTGTLHSVFYAIPDGLAGNFSNGAMVDLEIPVGYANTAGAMPFIPLDSVYQTQDSSFVYVVGMTDSAKNQIAQVRDIDLGPVFGSFVEVNSGLEASDQVIIDRNVVDGDIIQTREQSLIDMEALPETGVRD